MSEDSCCFIAFVVWNNRMTNWKKRRYSWDEGHSKTSFNLIKDKEYHFTFLFHKRISWVHPTVLNINLWPFTLTAILLQHIQVFYDFQDHKLLHRFKRWIFLVLFFKNKNIHQPKKKFPTLTFVIFFIAHWAAKCIKWYAQPWITTLWFSFLINTRTPLCSPRITDALFSQNEMQFIQSKPLFLSSSWRRRKSASVVIVLYGINSHFFYQEQ